MFEINIQYRIVLKTHYYFIDLLLVFQKYMIVCNESNYAFNSVYYKNIDFLKNGRLNGHKKCLRTV